MGEPDAGAAVMDIADLRAALAWQAEHAVTAGAPRTARVVRALLAVLETDPAPDRPGRSHPHGAWIGWLAALSSLTGPPQLMDS